MSQLVDTGQGVAEFPDEMSHDEIAGVIKKQFYSPDNPPPAEIGIPEGALPNASALKAGVIKSEGIAPPVLQNLSGAIKETVAGIPGFVAQLPKFALEGTKLAQGTLSEKLDTLNFAAGKALPMGVQMAKDIESPLGSKESFRGFLQAGLMAAPGLELARGFKAGSLQSKLAPIAGEVPKLEVPPIQEAPGLTAKPETLAPQEEVTPQEQIEPVGVTEALAELKRRNVVTPGEVALPDKVQEQSQTGRTFATLQPTDEFGGNITPVSTSIINDLGGLISKSQAMKLGKYTGNADLWDDVPTLSHPTHNKIYNPNGIFPDVAAQGLYGQGLIKEPTVSAMWEAISKESKTSRSVLKETREQFKTESKIKDAGDNKIEAQDLNVGDSVKIDNEPFKVVAVDPDTFDVTLQDGKKYGVQEVKNGEVIYGEHIPIPASSDFLPESGLQAKPELPENTEVTIKASTSKGEPLEVKMGAREAEKVLNERKTALENLIDCLG